MNPSQQRISDLASLYLEQHPEFVPFKEEFMHPMVLALSAKIKPWMMERYESPVEFWSDMLEAAQAWFPDGNKTKLGHYFCVQFEVEDNVWWNGWPPIQPVLARYLAWRKSLRER